MERCNLASGICYSLSNRRTFVHDPIHSYDSSSSLHDFRNATPPKRKRLFSWNEMPFAQLLPDFLFTLFAVVYFFLQALILAIIPRSFRTKKSVQGEIALITGAGHGIGRALAVR